MGSIRPARVKNLSKGQRARAERLLIALAYRPDLLLLDRPSSGLDPIVRRDYPWPLSGPSPRKAAPSFSRLICWLKWERVSDYVAMIKGGKIVFCDTLDTIKATHFRLTLQFDEPRSAAPNMAAALSREGAGREWTALCSGPIGEIEASVKAVGARVVAKAAVSLDDIFVARVGAKLPSEGRGGGARFPITVEG